MFQPADRQPFVAGTAAEVSLENERTIGFIGEIDPKVVEFERVPFRVFAFELDLEALEDAFKMLTGLSSTSSPAGRHARPGRRGPDYGFVCRYRRFDPVRRPGPGWSSIRLVDQYQGSQVPPGHQSLAFHMVFRDPERTLTAEEVAETMDRIVAVLKERFGAELASVTSVVTVARACPCHSSVSSPCP